MLPPAAQAKTAKRGIYRDITSAVNRPVGPQGRLQPVQGWAAVAIFRTSIAPATAAPPSRTSAIRGQRKDGLVVARPRAAGWGARERRPRDTFCKHLVGDVCPVAAFPWPTRSRMLTPENAPQNRMADADRGFHSGR